MSGKRGETEIERLPGHPDDACVCLMYCMFVVVVVVVVLAVLLSIVDPNLVHSAFIHFPLLHNIYHLWPHTHPYKHTYTLLFTIGR